MPKKQHIVHVACALLMAIGVCLFVGSAAASVQSRMSARSSCPDVLVIDLRGSGEAKGKLSSPGRIFAKALQNALSEESMESIPFPYPAAGDKWAMVGAVVKIAFIGKYHDSVTIGKHALKTVIIKLNQSCPSTKIILVGYSQGAHVIGDVYPRWAGVLYGAILFGDPKFNPVNGAINKHSFNPFRHGRLGARSMLKGKKASHYLSYCHRRDPVCQNIGIKEALKVRFKWHKNYQSFGEPQAAAKYFARLITTGDKTTPLPPTEPQNKWPTKKNNGTLVFNMWLGSSFIVPEWVSCSDNYCIVGSEDKVLVFKLHDIEQIGDGIPINVSNPRIALSERGIPAEEIDVLLSA